MPERRRRDATPRTPASGQPPRMSPFVSFLSRHQVHTSGRTPVAGVLPATSRHDRRRHLGALTRLPGPTDRTARNARANDSKRQPSIVVRPDDERWQSTRVHRPATLPVVRVVVVGAGGVGSAFVTIASRRDAIEHIVVADIDLRRAERAASTAGGNRTAPTGHGDHGRRHLGGVGRRARPGEPRRRRPQRLRATVQPGDLRGRLRRRRALPRHGDAPVGPPPRAAVQRRRRAPRRGAARRFGGLGGAWPAGHRRDGRRARVLRRRGPLRQRPPLLAHRRDRRARRRRPRRRRLRLRPDVLDLDDDRGVPQPADRLRARAWLVHDRPVQRAGGVPVPRGHRAAVVRQRRARGGRVDAAVARRRTGHVQVRPRPGVHRRPPDPAQARSRRHRPGRGQGRGGVAARRGRRRARPTPRRSARTCAARRAPARGCAAPGPTARTARSTCTTSSTTPGRCASSVTRRWSGRRR